jgi:hypothetical protein
LLSHVKDTVSSSVRATRLVTTGFELAALGRASVVDFAVAIDLARVRTAVREFALGAR